MGTSSESLRRLFDDFECELNEDFFKKCYIFTKLLLEWSRVHNISAARSEDAVAKEIYDSVFPLSFLPEFRTCLDIGSGAGFPALPLAFIKKEVSFTLCEPLSKRHSFLTLAALECEASNVKAENCRIEELPDAKFELITSRAVMDAASLFTLSERFVKKGSHWLFYKGENVTQEIAAFGNDDTIKIMQRGSRNYLMRSYDQTTF